jgi:SOS response regulatory protein OraA/RecX
MSLADEYSEQNPARIAVFDFDGTLISGQSGFLLFRYLLSRGYPREAAKNASDALDRDEIRAALREQLLKKYPAAGEAGRDGMAKAVAALMRLGFAPDDIRAAIRETDRT